MDVTLGAVQYLGREFALMITRRELLEISIAQLKTLAAFLSDQLAGAADGAVALETRACKQILSGVSNLIEAHQGSCAALEARATNTVGGATLANRPDDIAVHSSGS